jgi:hypothetical protein
MVSYRYVCTRIANYNYELWKCPMLKLMYSQTCVQRPPLGPEKCGRYAEGYMKKISGK